MKMNSSHLHVYTLEQNQKWDEIVKSFNDYDVYYLSGYAEAFKLNKDGEPLLFYYEDNDLKAINVVMKRDISDDKHFSFLEKNKYFDFATPYGYGGWLVEGESSLTNLFNEYKDWCIKNDIISEVIRFHPILDNQKEVDSFYDVMAVGNTIKIDTTSEEEIWNNFSSKNRNVIRKAIKNNVVIKHALNDELMSSFKDIYKQTMDKDSADSYYYFDDDFYESIMHDLNNNAEIFYAEYDEKIIAASIILTCNNRINYHLSGSVREYSSLAATNLLLSEISKWGANNGYTTFHLGGGVGAKHDSLYSFKKSFNRNDDLAYCIGKLVFNKDKYDELVSYRKEELREDYFPLYRS